MQEDRICSVIGLGYIGLPTAVVIAANGFRVNGIDLNPKVVSSINFGQAHFVEKDLDALLGQVVSAKRLSASTDLIPADTYIIAVPTPIGADKSPNLAYIDAAVAKLAPILQKGDLLILESTSPVGTTARMTQTMQSLRPDLRLPTQSTPGDIAVCYCPERVLPGKIMHELVHNDRLIGGVSPVCAEKGKSFYQHFVIGQCFTTTAETAELTKLTENAYRDVNIAFANELSMICDQVDVDVSELINLANHHPRVNILKPGIGVGGHCIAVDPWFIVHAAKNQAKIIKTARDVNDYKTEYIVDQLKEKIVDNNDNQIAFFGLAFKPNVDDLRGSPAIQIVSDFADDYSGDIYIIEPFISVLPESLLKYPNIQLIDISQLPNQVVSLVGLVAHQQFSVLTDLFLQGKTLIDFANVFPRKCVVSQDITDNLAVSS